MLPALEASNSPEPDTVLEFVPVYVNVFAICAIAALVPLVATWAAEMVPACRCIPPLDCSFVIEVSPAAGVNVALVRAIYWNAAGPVQFANAVPKSRFAAQLWPIAVTMLSVCLYALMWPSGSLTVTMMWPRNVDFSPELDLALSATPRGFALTSLIPTMPTAMA